MHIETRTLATKIYTNFQSFEEAIGIFRLWIILGRLGKFGHRRVSSVFAHCEKVKKRHTRKQETS